MESHISQVTLPVVCAACGIAMKRTHDTKRKSPEAWDCVCGVRVWLADSDLLAEITEILNRLICNPALIIEETHQPDEAKQLMIRRLQNDIARQLEGFDFDRDAVQRDIFALAAAKYKTLPGGPATTYLLRGLFEKSEILESFARKLLEAAALQILLGKDEVFIKLKNGQTIGKDDDHGSGTAKNGTHNPGET